MNDEDRILEDIKEILKELDEQGRMKYTQRYMQPVSYTHLTLPTKA